jgi:hypothetical protein
MRSIAVYSGLLSRCTSVALTRVPLIERYDLNRGVTDFLEEPIEG